MEAGDKQTKRGKKSINTFGKLHPNRERFFLKPETVKDPQQQNPV